MCGREFYKIDTMKGADTISKQYGIRDTVLRYQHAGEHAHDYYYATAVRVGRGEMYSIQQEDYAGENELVILIKWRDA